MKKALWEDERTILTEVKMAEVSCALCLAFIDVFGQGEIPLQFRLMKHGDNARQWHADCRISEEDCGLPIAELTSRYLAPMAAGLAQVMPRDKAFGLLELPSGCQAARETMGNVSIRVITGMYAEPIVDEEGEVVGYHPPKPIIRIDAITTTQDAP